MTGTRDRIVFTRVSAAVACTFFVACCATASRSPQTELNGAIAALERGDTADAVSLLEEQTSRGTSEPSRYIRLAELYRSRGTVLDRLCSQRVLEQGLRAHPDNLDLLVELGKTYYKRSFYGDAQRTFLRVLSRDSLRCEAHAYLGANAFRKWKNVQPYTEHLYTAVAHLRHVSDCAPEDAHNGFKLAFSHFVLGDTALALSACESLRRRHPDAPEPLFLSGAIAFYRARWEDCRDYFAGALALLTDEDRIPYTTIALFLDSKEEARRYEEASPEERLRLERCYWLEHDPDPTTEINPRLLENICRVFLSDVRFACSGPHLRGWDTPRGVAFIKFGEPGHVRTTLQGSRPWDGRTEVWTYTDAGRAFDLYFRDDYGNGNYTVPIKDELSTSTLYETPVVSVLGNDASPLDGTMDVAAFRESEVSCAVYVMFSAHDDSLQRHLWTWRVDHYTSRVAFFGEEGDPRAYFSRTIPSDSLPLQGLRMGRLRYVASMHELPFDSYRVAHSFTDERGLTRSVTWSTTNTLRFTGGSLVLSDILLHAVPTDRRGPFVERFGKRLFPNPHGRFAHSERLRLYLEIYNLTLSRRTSVFDVSYSIYAVRPDPGIWHKITRRVRHGPAGGGPGEPVISQSFQRTGVSTVATEELAIDIDSLEPGDYNLYVSVRDGNSGERASTSKRFTKIDATAEP